MDSKLNVLICTTLCTGGVGVFAAETLHVPQGFATIQEAVDAANSGDTVLVAPGVYVVPDPIRFNHCDLGASMSTAVKNIVLESEGGSRVTTIMKTGEPGSVVNFYCGETRASVIEGFTITGGHGVRLPLVPLESIAIAFSRGLGGGITCLQSSPTIRNCVIIENGAMEGGGIRCSLARPHVQGCRISRNWGGSGAGLYTARRQLHRCASDN